MLTVEKWKSVINSNRRLVENGRWINMTFTFGIEDKDYLFHIINGKVQSIDERSVLTKSGVFKIHGKTKVWDKHWLELPPRDYHDIFSMLAKNLVSIDGDLTRSSKTFNISKTLLLLIVKLKMRCLTMKKPV